MTMHQNITAAQECTRSEFHALAALEQRMRAISNDADEADVRHHEEGPESVRLAGEFRRTDAAWSGVRKAMMTIAPPDQDAARQQAALLSEYLDNVDAFTPDDTGDCIAALRNLANRFPAVVEEDASLAAELECLQRYDWQPPTFDQINGVRAAARTSDSVVDLSSIRKDQERQAKKQAIREQFPDLYQTPALALALAIYEALPGEGQARAALTVQALSDAEEDPRGAAHAACFVMTQCRAGKRHAGEGDA